MTALERMLEKADHAEELSGFEARALCQSLALHLREMQTVEAHARNALQLALCADNSRMATENTVVAALILDRKATTLDAIKAAWPK